MNAKVEITQEDEFQLAASLINFKIEDIEVKDGSAEFNLIYRYDSDLYVTCHISTITDIGEYAYQPDGSNDPQDEQCTPFDFPIAKGLATVIDFYGVAVQKDQLILLTDEQLTALNDQMHTIAYFDVPNKMKAAVDDHLVSLAEARAEAMMEC